MKAAKAINPEDVIRVLKVGKCPTLSAKSTLTYHIGCNARSEIHICVHSNTGGGFFNKDWVSLEGIQQQLDKGPSDKSLTSHALYPIFRGRSTNTPAFLLAVVKHEGLVQASKDKKRCYERLDAKPFLAEMKSLIASKVSLTVAPVATKAKPKADATVKPATASKAVIKGKQFAAGKKPTTKTKRK